MVDTGTLGLSVLDLPRIVWGLPSLCKRMWKTNAGLFLGEMAMNTGVIIEVPHHQLATSPLGVHPKTGACLPSTTTCSHRPIAVINTLPPGHHCACNRVVWLLALCSSALVSYKGHTMWPAKDVNIALQRSYVCLQCGAPLENQVILGGWP